MYDGTVAADYYQAMLRVEKHLNGSEGASPAPLTPAELVALVDSLRGGTLNESQLEKLGLLRAGILALAESEATMKLVKDA